MSEVDSYAEEASYKPTGLKRFVLAFLTTLCVALIFVPLEFGLYEPISVQVFARDRWACALFYCLGGVLLYTAVRLWNRESPFTAIFCGLSVLCLAVVSVTYPFSAIHFIFFASLLALSLTWMWRVQKEFEDGLLKACAIGASVGTVACLFSMGIGERMVMLSMLGGINVLYYKFVSY